MKEGSNTTGCIVHGCKHPGDRGKFFTSGYCIMHRRRLAAHGTLDDPPSRKTPLATRFWPKVYKTSNCWFWIGRTDHGGYGVLERNTTFQLAHRVSWFLHHGTIPKKKIVLHHCDTPQIVEGALERNLDPEAEFERRLAKQFLKAEPDYSKLDIKVSCVCPPIPVRYFDYCAVDDATYDGGDENPIIGEGPTPLAAIYSLVERIAERDDTDPLHILLAVAYAKETKCNQPAHS